jgi:hypothetical protein
MGIARISFGPIRSKGLWSLSKQFILVDDNVGVAPRTDVAVIGPYPFDGFGSTRANNFDALIVEQVFGHSSPLFRPATPLRMFAS